MLPTLEELTRAPEVDEAYRCLDAWFGVRGELERRSVIDGWLAHPEGQSAEGIRVRYHLLAARAPDGSLAAVRDCHTTFDPASGVCVAYLAHVFVAPAYRRTGLAQRLREVPTELARRDLEAWGVGARELLLAAEQEPIRLDRDDTLTRLVAYGRAGFSAIDPDALPYLQPDFSDLEASGLPARPLPLLAVLRREGHPSEHTLPAGLAEAFVRNLYAVFSTHCRATDLEAARRFMLDRLAQRSPGGGIRLLSLPRSLEDSAAIEPLLEARVLASGLGSPAAPSPRS